MNVAHKEPRNKSISMTPTYNSKSPRTVIILVDCLRAGEGSLFEQDSEGAFLLGLGSLLAGGSGGRLLLCSVVPVPEGESMSAHTRAAQARRQKLERLALDALLRGQKSRGRGKNSPDASIAHSFIAPVV